MTQRDFYQQCPGKSFLLLEGLESFGGTWRMHNYPGIRSDSDLYTFGYRFKPWTGPPIATGEEILHYIGEVIDENDLDSHIRYQQTWPEDLEYRGKDVIVIGSGATAATLVPAIAGDCSHVTLLQRSPTYFISGRNENELADQLRELEVDEAWIHEITRKKILHDQAAITRLSFDQPEFLKKELIAGVRALLGSDFDIEKHFTPNYRPWRQRIAFIPDGDLFEGIKSGKASIVTDEIDKFTKQGIALKSGRVLEADIVVTATGFNLSVLGDIDFCVDDKPEWQHTQDYWAERDEIPRIDLDDKVFAYE